MRTVSDAGLAKIKQWEGLKLSAYRDGGGVWTIGYGHASDSVFQVGPGQHITEDFAEKLLRHDLAEAQLAVAAAVKVALNDNQFAALVSFCFNVGSTAFRKSTLVKKLNSGDYDAVPFELARWNKDNGKVVKGLTMRRAAEAGLWASGAFVASASVKAASRDPLKTVISKPEVVGAASTLGAGAFTAAASPGPMAWAIAAVIVVVAGVALYLFIRRELRS